MGGWEVSGHHMRNWRGGRVGGFGGSWVVCNNRGNKEDSFCSEWFQPLLGDLQLCLEKLLMNMQKQSFAKKGILLYA